MWDFVKTYAFVCCGEQKTGGRETGSMHSACSGHTATLLKDGRVLIAVGDLSAEIFNPATASFTVTGSMATARVGATATLLQDGKVLIAGGVDLNGRTDTGQLPTLNTAELYEPVTGTLAKQASGWLTLRGQEPEPELSTVLLSRRHSSAGRDRDQQGGQEHGERVSQHSQDECSANSRHA
jgi:hypothetical protein